VAPVKTTISLIKADIGSIGGHTRTCDAVTDIVRQTVAAGQKSGLIIDYKIWNAGDDTEILMTHTKGVDNEEIHRLAYNALKKGADSAHERGLYGAGQDLLKDAFSGNVRGMGPGAAEIEFEERQAEPFVAFAADKTAPGAFNYPIFRIFADPFNTAGLVIDQKLHDGFNFEVYDIKGNKKVLLQAPQEYYDLVALVGATEDYVIKRVFSKDEKLGPAAVISTEKLYAVAGKYVGKDDPVAIVRAQSGFPATGEVLEGFALGHLVTGWMRGSHNGPLMPVPLRYSQCTRFDGPPRITGLAFSMKNGRLTEALDVFDDPAWDSTRERCMYVADYLRRHGPFEPHRLPPASMEYTTLPVVLDRLKSRFKPIK